MAGRRGNGAVPAALTIAVGVAGAVYFAPLGDWVAADPLPGQQWMKSHIALALSLFGAVTLFGAVLALWQRGARPAAGSAVHPWDPQQDGYLEDVRRRMRVVWIDQFLARSLERVVPARLGLRERKDGITGPLRVVDGDGPDEVADIVALYEADRTQRRLVVLGEPGAGKTTQLLHLAEHLLADGAGPVPIVVSLSTGSWKVEPGRETTLQRTGRADEATYDEKVMRRERLRAARRVQADLAVAAAIDWLSWEISRLYQVPEAKVAAWLRMDRSPIVLLLDGLDEIRNVEDRRRCVGVLSLLRSRLNTAIVVCCRTKEYFESERLLNFGAAAEITPLSAADIDQYLADAGDELASLRGACGRNAELVRLLNTPLALTVAVLAYRGRLVDDAAVAELLAGRLDHLWSAYLAEALQRRRSLTTPGKPRFGDEATMGHLRGLARLMESGGRDTFAMENLTLAWVRKADPAPPGRIPMGAYAVVALCAALGLAGYELRVKGAGYAIASVVVLILTALMQWRIAQRVNASGLSQLQLAEFVAGRWRLDLPSALLMALPSISTGLMVGVCIGALGGVDGLLLGLLPGVTAGAAAAVLALPVRAAPRRKRGAGRVRSVRTAAARRTLFVRVVTGAVALVVWWRLAAVLAAVVGAEVRSLAYHLMIAAAAGAWLTGFAVSLRGWWSHRAAVRSVLRRGVLPRDVREFFPHLEEQIIMRRTPSGYAFGQPRDRLVRYSFSRPAMQDSSLCDGSGVVGAIANR
ncbi:NACHT domain-containing protein [Amycolatopsis sp. lyj-23]|uniref:NACHT domain-containing protein n=1 Tax=Amycolatopsis sp. lyj-23 TaxID=2789283 RepID=UPI00397907BE